MIRKDPSDISQAPKRYCPKTGLSIVQRPEWTMIEFGRDYLANFSILGGRILLSQPQGYITLPDTKASLALMDQAVSMDVGESEPYVMIEDLSRLKGASFEARKYFIDHLKKTELLRGLIFYNLSPLYRLSFKLAIRFITDSRPVKIVESYLAAVNGARDILKSEGISLKSDALFLKDYAHPIPLTDTPDDQEFITVQTSPEWHLDLDGFNVRIEIIGNTILHSVSSGYLKENHIIPISQLRWRIAREKGNDSSFDYFVAGVKNARVNTRTTRKQYMDDMKAFHAKYPFKAYIFYGAERRVGAAANLAKPFVPFKVHTANDFHDAMDFIRKDRQRRADQDFDRSKSRKKGRSIKQHEIRQYADELLHLLGSINWEVNGFTNQQRLPENHPFYQVYEAIRLIKGELDELFLEKKAQEREKFKLEEQLRHARKLEAIGTLIGGIAHDFNNILGIILGNTDLAIADTPDWSPVHEFLLDIRGASLRAKDVVGNLLCFSHESSIRRKPLGIVPLVEAAVDLQRTFIPENIKLVVTMLGHCRPILADPAQIRQLVTNLCSNAVHAMEEKGGTLTISIAETVHSGAYSDDGPDLPAGKFVKLRVSDTGHGISPDHMDRIFDPYFTTKEIGKGGGMGLAVVHGIAKGHEASIKVDSEPGKGTVFSIFFPIYDPKEKIMA